MDVALPIHIQVAIIRMFLLVMAYAYAVFFLVAAIVWGYNW